MELTYQIDADQVIAKFRAMPARMRQEMILTINRLTIGMQRSVVDNKLAGQVLKVRTGTLWRSIHQDNAVARDGGIFGKIYTKQDYGIAWENGFDRKIGAGARGGPRTLKGRALESYFARHPPGIKHENARPFMRPVLEEFTSKIKEDIRQTALGVLHGT